MNERNPEDRDGLSSPPSERSPSATRATSWLEKARARVPMNPHALRRYAIVAAALLIAFAIGIGVGDRVAILKHAYYSVISPEGCAGILWKSAEHSEKAAKALRFTSDNLLRLKHSHHNSHLLLPLRILIPGLLS